MAIAPAGVDYINPINSKEEAHVDSRMGVLKVASPIFYGANMD